MKLETLDSRMILPSTFVEDGEIPVMERLAWACAAFDIFVKGVDARRLVLSAPYSLESIQALTDDELQQYYKEFGLATYYPDISRNARNLMLYDEQRLYHKLGTKAAVEALVQYIFGDNPITLEITDNLAFGADGQMISESLLNLYDATITAEIASLDRFQLARIFDNITKFNRDTQQLRNIIIRYESEQTLHFTMVPNDTACIFYDSDVLCEYPQTAPVLFFTINKTTGAETVGNEEVIVEPVAKGGEIFEGNKPPRLISYQTDELSVPKGGEVFEGGKTPALQSLGNNLFFTISKTPDA